MPAPDYVATRAALRAFEQFRATNGDLFDRVRTFEETHEWCLNEQRAQEDVRVAFFHESKPAHSREACMSAPVSWIRRQVELTEPCNPS